MKNNDIKNINTILKDVIKRLTDLSNSLYEEDETPVVEAKKKHTLEEVRRVLAELSRDGFTAQVRELLLKHGAKKLSEVKEDDYESLLKEAGELRNGE